MLLGTPVKGWFIQILFVIDLLRIVELRLLSCDFSSLVDQHGIACSPLSEINAN